MLWVLMLCCAYGAYLTADYKLKCSWVKNEFEKDYPEYNRRDVQRGIAVAMFILIVCSSNLQCSMFPEKTVYVPAEHSEIKAGE